MPSTNPSPGSSDTSLRPAQNLRDLQDRPTAQVLVVHDTLALTAASDLFPGFVAVAPAGSTSAGYRGTDWTCLLGRNVVLMPSATEDSRASHRWLRGHLRIRPECGAASVKLCDPEHDRPDGWSLDCAITDGWAPERAYKWAAGRVAASRIARVDPPPPPAEPSEPTEDERPEPPPEDEDLNPVRRPARVAKPVLTVHTNPNASGEKSEQIVCEESEISEIRVCELWVAQHARDWRFVPATKVWNRWGADGWESDDQDIQRQTVIDLAGSISEAPSVSVSTRRSVGTARFVRGVRELAAAHPKIATRSDAWDSDPMLLGVPGGLCVELTGGRVREAKRSDYITIRTACAPESGPPTLWLDHLAFVMQGDEEKIEFIRRYFGYMLCGIVREHALLYFYGSGRNGKGVIVDSFVRIMGGYGYPAPPNLLMARSGESHPTALAGLYQKRAVSASEPSKGARWDDGLVRWLTGGDPITARRMRQDFWSFLPSHHFIVMGNHRPSMASVDEAVRSRIMMLDFEVTIPVARRDPKFAEKLKPEYPKILNWAIEGCLEWQTKGLAPPESVQSSTTQYMDRQDVIWEFLRACYVRTDEKDAVRMSDVYKRYKRWCEEQGEISMNRRELIGELEKNKLQLVPIGGVDFLRGLRAPIGVD